tara:strand:+ start:1469 stop:1849 length:381 start_codon:yes stop_codon:yes gene_type:complete
MLLAAYDPGREMAIANFFLAIFCLFTIALPLLLITRGDKTKSNREFIAATVNPWSQIAKEIELTPVVISGISPTTEVKQQTEIIHDSNDERISESEGVFSIETEASEALEKTSHQVLATNEEVLAA